MSHFHCSKRYGLYKTLIGKWVFWLKCAVKQVSTTSGSRDIEFSPFLAEMGQKQPRWPQKIWVLRFSSSPCRNVPKLTKEYRSQFPFHPFYYLYWILMIRTSPVGYNEILYNEISSFHYVINEKPLQNLKFTEQLLTKINE